MLEKKIISSWLTDFVLVLLLNDETENGAARLDIKSTGRLEDASGVTIYRLMEVQG